MASWCETKKDKEKMCATHTLCDKDSTYVETVASRGSMATCFPMRDDIQSSIEDVVLDCCDKLNRLSMARLC